MRESGRLLTSLPLRVSLSQVQAATEILRLLSARDHNGRAKIEFAEAGGFLLVVQILSSLHRSGTAATQGDDLGGDSEQSKDEDHQRMNVLRLALAILCEALGDDRDTPRAFLETIGWAGLESALDLSDLRQVLPDAYFVTLLQLMLGDSVGLARPDHATLDDPEHLRSQTIVYAAVLPMMLREAQSSTHQKPRAAVAGTRSLKRFTGILSALVSNNAYNAIAVQKSGITSKLLGELFVLESSAASPETSWLIDILQPVYRSAGLPDEDAQMLLRACCPPAKSSLALTLLATLAENEDEPNTVTLDMSRHGHSSVAFSSLAKPFPPRDAHSDGWTFFTTFRIRHWEGTEPLEILHLFDAQRTCSVKLSISPQTGYLSYMHRLDEPCAEFTGFRFEADKFHQLTLIQTRPRNHAPASLAQLLVDGRMVEQQHVQWPMPPATVDSPIRAVFGTAPPAEKSSKNNNRQAWSLGPTFMLDNCMPPDFPLVLKMLGPSYAGNLQDSLGRFLTYEASTAINLRLDSIARTLAKDSQQAEKDLANHSLITAIAGRSGELFPESRLYFSLNPACTALRHRSAKTMVELEPSHRPASTVLLNQAVTLTRNALSASFGYAKLYGAAAIVCPSRLADVVWRLGGSSILLQLIESRDELLVTVKVFCDIVRKSWRLCEDVEKSGAYEVLNLFLRRRAADVTVETLQCLLHAVGVDESYPDQAALVNPFMYRVIILDFSLWSQCDLAVQIAHLAHFTALLRTSKHRRFNIKRVAKMQVVKRLLFHLNESTLSPQLVQPVLEVLRTLLVASWSEPVLKTVMTYLSSRLCPHESLQRKNFPQRPKPRRMATSDNFAPEPSQSLATKNSSDGSKMPLQILELLVSLASERPVFLAKLARISNVRWILLFLHPGSENGSTTLALELMARLLITQRQYMERFHTAGGWKVLERLLPQYWEKPQVVPLCFSILFGQQRKPNTSLSQAFAPPLQIHCPQMLRIIINCFNEALKASRSDSGRGGSARPRPSDLLEVTPSLRARDQRHMRKRSNSVNIDPRSFASSFKETYQQSLIQETSYLIGAHCVENPWRALLFSPAVLRAICEGVEPFVASLAVPNGTLSSPKHVNGLADKNNSSTLACYELLQTLARFSVEHLFSNGSTSLVSDLFSAVPTRDLAQQGVFRFTLTNRIIHEFRVQLKATTMTSAALLAFAQFIEQASHDILQGSALEDTLFDTITDLLTDTHNRKLPTMDAQEARLSLHSSLNRIVLYRLTDDAATLPTFQRILHWQSLLLRSNPDTIFVECLTNRILNIAPSCKGELRQASEDLIKLIVFSKPQIAQKALPEGKTSDDVLAAEANIFEIMRPTPSTSTDEVICLPYDNVWQGFLKSAGTLRIASHLDRVARLRQMLDHNESRDKMIASTQQRMMAWHAGVMKVEEQRRIKHFIDLSELQISAQQTWARTSTALYQERALLGPHVKSGRIWQLDPIEGPQRMRKRLMEQPKTTQPDQVPYQETMQTAPTIAGHGDPWGSVEQAETNEDSTTTEDPEPSMTPSTSQLLAAAEIPDRDVESRERADEQGTDEQDDHEHKFRKVLRSLERGDRVEGVVNASRVVGIDCRAALCITGKLCLYLVDDYFQRANGELVNVWQAPEAERDAYVLAALSSDSNQPSSFLAQLEGDGQTRKWPWAALRRVHRRFFLHRGTALELFFDDGQSCLLVLPTVSEANALLKDLGSRCRSAITGAEQMRAGIREPAQQAAAENGEGRGRVNFGARLGAVLGRQQAGVITEAWRQRKISNFDYIMRLNTLAGRSFNDLSQYPVFPWIIADYTSSELDLTNPATFRKLDLPMGAQSPERQVQFDERYQALSEIDEPPFHYGTHYSTAATTAGYLIRLRPFEKLLIALQGGSFDLAERTFASVAKAWKSASELSRGDVRELTPEFFYLPEFLVNSNRFDFGATQAGSRIDDVDLPPWAKGDPRLFVQKNMEALECEYVSARLHHWIDLIFGYKQTGPEAVKAVNVFHPLSYADEVDLDSITDPNERRAASATVWNFGVTPARLFERPHVRRYGVHGSLPRHFSFHTTPWMVIQSIAPLRTIKTACHFLYVESSSGHQGATGSAILNHDEPCTVYASPSDYLIMGSLGISLSAGHLDGSVRMFKSSDPARPVAVLEQPGIERILCMRQVGPQTVAMGCKDGLILLWKIDAAKREFTVPSTMNQSQGQSTALRGHQPGTGVTCLAASQDWRIAVSGGEEGTAIVWDTNRGVYVRSLQGRSDGVGAVTQVAVDEEQGLIATIASAPLADGQQRSHDGDDGEIRVWSVNGDLLATSPVSLSSAGSVTALAFLPCGNDFTGSFQSGVQRLTALATGHGAGKIVCWSVEHASSRDTPPSSGAKESTTQWSLTPCHVFEHSNRLPNSGPQGDASTITSLLPVKRGGNSSSSVDTLLVGDAMGRVYSWVLAGSEGPNIASHSIDAAASGPSSGCMNCRKKWGVLESKRTCKGCGGLFCSSCTALLHFPPPAPAVGSPREREQGESGVTASSPAGRWCVSCKDVCSTALL